MSSDASSQNLRFSKSHLILAIFFIVIGSGLAFSMSDKNEIYTWRYKTTIIIETPEGEKTGSAVRETTVDFAVCMGCTPKVSTKGEAAFVDLGKRGKVFEVMGADPHMVVFSSFPGPPGLTGEGQKYYSTLKNAKVSLNTGNLQYNMFTQYPIMVTFKDTKNPKSIELVYQSEAVRVQGQAHFDFKITNNFEQVFGKGVTLKDVQVEMTDEPVKFEIQGFLPWLPKYYNQRLDGARFGILKSEYRLANSLSAGNFLSGVSKDE